MGRGEWRLGDGKKGKNTKQLFLETDNPFISNIFLSFESSIQRSLDIETKSFPGFSITNPYETREREREEKEKILGTRFNIRAFYPQLIKSESMGAPGRCATCHLSDFAETWPV